jgi:hypothetical protein
MGFLTPSELPRGRDAGGCLSGLQSPVGMVRGGGHRGSVLIPYFNRLFGQAKRVRP